MSVIDRRLNGKGKSYPNRKKFIDRYKRQIKESVKQASNSRSIKDADKGVDINIDGNTTTEPDYHLDPNTGRRNNVHSGNDQFRKGDRQEKPYGEGGRGGAGDSGEGEDDFTFTLTKEEFFDLYFEDMALPDFIKESLAGSTKFKFKRAGYTKDGVPTRLNSKKTMEMSIARRIAAKAQGKKKPLYLDDVDIKYDNIVRKPYPITKAVMFLVMDVSGSMMQKDKTLSKKFFILLYLFLTKCYDEVEIRFIRHHHIAEEVDEETFFYDREMGGTIVSKAFILINDMINKEINLQETNVYIAQASDGDNWERDNDILNKIIEEEILPKVQYMAYIQTRGLEEPWRGAQSLYLTYDDLTNKHEKFNKRIVRKDADVYPVLRELFERKQQ